MQVWSAKAGLNWLSMGSYGNLRGKEQIKNKINNKRVQGKKRSQQANGNGLTTSKSRRSQEDKQSKQVKKMCVCMGMKKLKSDRIRDKTYLQKQLPWRFLFYVQNSHFESTK